MSTPTLVANLTLDMAGMPTIDDFTTDSTEVGEYLRRWWPVIFKEMLEKGSWPQFRKRQSLALLDSTPGTDLLYGFSKPDDFIRIEQILTDNVHYFTLADNGTIRADVSALLIEYVSDSLIYLPNLWGPTFELAFRSALAARLHAKFDTDKEKEAAMNQQAIATTREAQIQAGQQQNRKTFRMTTWRGEEVVW